MVLPYGGRVGWRRIVKRVPEMEPAFFYLIILTKPNRYWLKKKVNALGMPPHVKPPFRNTIA